MVAYRPATHRSQLTAHRSLHSLCVQRLQNEKHHQNHQFRLDRVPVSCVRKHKVIHRRIRKHEPCEKAGAGPLLTQGATQSLKHELGGLRTGRAAASMLEPVQVDAYGSHMPLNQLATISVPEPLMLSVQVWDKSMVKAVEKAIVDSNLGLSPATEGQVLRLRIPELNQERRKELVKVAHKYAEAAKVAVRHVRRDGLDTVKKLEKNHEISEDDQERLAIELLASDSSAPAHQEVGSADGESLSQR